MFNLGFSFDEVEAALQRCEELDPYCWFPSTGVRLREASSIVRAAPCLMFSKWLFV